MTLVAAHRGLSAEQPENTIRAFQAAAAAGFQAVELDVRMTHDHEVVVLHDASIARTTDGTGRVADIDYDELRTHDTGVGPVPRLGDVFAAMEDWPGWWDIEVKALGATEAAIDVVEHYGLGDHAIVSSFDPDALRKAHKHHPELGRGLIVLGPPDDEDLQAALDAHCTWIKVDHDFLDEPQITRLREAGLHIGAWTVNDIEEARRLVAAGVDLIITDTRDVLGAIGPPGPDP